MSWNQALKDFLDVYRDLHRDAPEAQVLLERIDKIGQERFAGAIP
jgi:hypothetical protein